MVMFGIGIYIYSNDQVSAFWILLSGGPKHGLLHIWPFNNFKYIIILFIFLS